MATTGLSSPAPLRARRGRLWSRLRGGWAVPQYEIRGVMQLGEHVRARAGRLTGPSQDAYRDWIESEFTYPLRALLWATARSRRAYMGLNLLVVAGGFATSGIAIAAGSGTKGSVTSWVVFALGFSVAIVGGVNQQFRPGHRATERNSVTVDMREEGWSFAMGSAEYAGDDAAAFALFQSRVFALQRRIASIGQLESDQHHTGNNQASRKRQR